MAGDCGGGGEGRGVGLWGRWPGMHRGGGHGRWALLAGGAKGRLADPVLGRWAARVIHLARAVVWACAMGGGDVRAMPAGSMRGVLRGAGGGPSLNTCRHAKGSGFQRGSGLA